MLGDKECKYLVMAQKYFGEINRLIDEGEVEVDSKKIPLDLISL